MTTLITTTLSNGMTVLAKMYHGRPSAMTYANRTQAANAALKCGGEVFQPIGSRPFFVTVKPETGPAPLTLVKADGSRVPVAESDDGQGSEWTARTDTMLFRVCRFRGRLYRKEVHEMYFGGHQVKYVSLANTRLVSEWLEG